MALAKYPTYLIDTNFDMKKLYIFYNKLSTVNCLELW